VNPGSSVRLGIAAIAAVLALSTPAGAQSAAQQAAAATSQFDRGRSLMKEKKYAAACAAFETSQKLDPQWGTLYNLASCYAKAGKLASAWAAYRELAQRDTKPTRRKDSARQARALDQRLPRLMLTAAAPPAGLAVALDGADVTALIGTENPVDLGVHAIHATAPGRADLDTTATISDEGKTVTVAIELAPAERPRPVAATPAAPRPAPASRAQGDEPSVRTPDRAPSGSATGPAIGSASGSPAEPGAEPRSRRRMYGVLVAAGGGALVATGLVFGRLAGNDWNEARGRCGGGTTCDNPGDLAAGNRLVDRARSRANLATGLAIGGAAAIGVGAYLLLTAPHGDAPASTALRVAPSAGPGSMSFTLEGRF
jgi:hypothetical protein